jgi:transposase
MENDDSTVEQRTLEAAMTLIEKYGQHQPLNRQADRYARQGVDLSLSTLADQVGGCAVVPRLIYDLTSRRSETRACYIRNTLPK